MNKIENAKITLTKLGGEYGRSQSILKQFRGGRINE